MKSSVWLCRGILSEEELKLPLSKHTCNQQQCVGVFLNEDVSFGHGGHVWDSSWVLARFLAESALEMQGLRVIEIGSGAGLPGLTACALGADVTLTDKAAYTPLLEQNIALNFSPYLPRDSSGTATAAAFAFGASLKRAAPSCRPPFSLILLADVVGLSSDYYPSLVKSLQDLMRGSGEGCSALLAHRERAEWEASFFELLEEAGLKYSEVKRYSCRQADDKSSGTAAAAALAATAGSLEAEEGFAPGSVDAATAVPSSVPAGVIPSSYPACEELAPSTPGATITTLAAAGEAHASVTSEAAAATGHRKSCSLGGTCSSAACPVGDLDPHPTSTGDAASGGSAAVSPSCQSEAAAPPSYDPSSPFTGYHPRSLLFCPHQQGDTFTSSEQGLSSDVVIYRIQMRVEERAGKGEGAAEGGPSWC